MDCRKLNRTNKLFGAGDKHAGHLLEQDVAPEELAPGNAHTWHVCGMGSLQVVGAVAHIHASIRRNPEFLCRRQQRIGIGLVGSAIFSAIHAGKRIEQPMSLQALRGQDCAL